MDRSKGIFLRYESRNTGCFSMISESVHNLESDSSFVQNSSIKNMGLAQSIHSVPTPSSIMATQMNLLWWRTSAPNISSQGPARPVLSGKLWVVCASPSLIQPGLGFGVYDACAWGEDVAPGLCGAPASQQG